MIGFKQDVKEFFQSKSNWTGITSIVVGGYLIHIGEVRTGIESIFAGLALIFVKDAIAKIGPTKNL